MFESVLKHLLSALGAGDQLIAVMGPSFTILLSWVAGGAVAQFLKYPLSRRLQDPNFSFVVRLIAITSTLVFAHLLSDSIHATLEVVVALVQPLVYHVSLAMVRKWWPWLETRRFVGSISPPPTAVTANQLRLQQKAEDMNPPDGA